jgi:hypothetical protein
MANEMDSLLKELQAMKRDRKTIHNSKDVWSAIGQRDWTAAGFENEAEAIEWINNNPYSNL